KGTGEIRIDDRFPLFESHVFKRHGWCSGSRVVEQEIQPPERLDGLSEESPDGPWIADICGNAEHSRAHFRTVPCRGLQARLAACTGADPAIADKRHAHRLPLGVLARMTRCLLIQMPAVGYDVIDYVGAAEFGIAVANAAGYNRDAVADWTVMAILNLIRRGSWGDHRLREGGWPKPEMMGRELGALTVGIVGLGNVGRALAIRLLSFGTRGLCASVVEKSLPGVERVLFG